MVKFVLDFALNTNLYYSITLHRTDTIALGSLHLILTKVHTKFQADRYSTFREKVERIERLRKRSNICPPPLHVSSGQFLLLNFYFFHYKNVGQKNSKSVKKKAKFGLRKAKF